MPFDSLTDNDNVQRLIAAGILAAFGAAAFVSYAAARATGRRLGASPSHQLAAEAVRSLSSLGAQLLLVLGLFLSLLALPDAQEWRAQVISAGTIGLVFVGGRAIANVLGAVINWYVRHVAPTTATKFDDSVLPLVRRSITVAVYGIAMMIVLDTLGVSISPLLGGLGISGLAVALALQPTLGNFFAGAYVLSEGAISTGDYIELQGGPAGYVESVGWRSTKIRTWLNNYVIIPNSVMSDTILTNYSRPDPRMNILVTCGVSYASDLARVNDLALEAAREVIAANPEAVKDEAPWFGFDRFGDSNVEFWLFLQARDRIGSFIVTNELIKHLHARFAEAGIEINYPVRKLVYDGPPPTELAARRAAS